MFFAIAEIACQRSVQMHHRHCAEHMRSCLPDAFVTFTCCWFHNVYPFSFEKSLKSLCKVFVGGLMEARGLLPFHVHDLLSRRVHHLPSIPFFRRPVFSVVVGV